MKTHRNAFYAAVILGVVLPCVPAYSDPIQSDPFQLIVPQAITFNTAGFTSGGIGTFWLSVGANPISFNASPPGAVFADYISDNFNVMPTAFFVFSNLTTLTPGELIAPHFDGPGLQLFNALVLPSDIVTTGSPLFEAAMRFPKSYTGSATLNFTIAIGQDIARFSMLATFVDLPDEPNFTTVTAAQRVSSEFDPDFALVHAPEINPQSGIAALTLLSGALLLVSGRRNSSRN